MPTTSKSPSLQEEKDTLRQRKRYFMPHKTTFYPNHPTSGFVTLQMMRPKDGNIHKKWN